MKLETKVVRAGIRPDPSTGAIVPPIYQSATFVLPEVGKNLGYDYTRSSNPTRATLEANLAALEVEAPLGLSGPCLAPPETNALPVDQEPRVAGRVDDADPAGLLDLAIDHEPAAELELADSTQLELRGTPSGALVEELHRGTREPRRAEGRGRGGEHDGRQDDE